MPKRTGQGDDITPSPLAGEGWGGGYANVDALIAHGGLWRWPRPSQSVYERTPRKRRNTSGNTCADGGWMGSDSEGRFPWAHMWWISPASPKGLLLRSMVDNMRHAAMKTGHGQSGSKATGIASCVSGITTSLRTRMALWKQYGARLYQRTERPPPSLTLPREGGGNLCAPSSLSV